MIVDQLRAVVFDECAEVPQDLWERIVERLRERRSERSDIYIVRFPRRRENKENRIA